MVFKKSFFKVGMWHSRPPPLHGKSHLKFPFWLFENLPNKRSQLPQNKINTCIWVEISKWNGWSDELIIQFSWAYYIRILGLPTNKWPGFLLLRGGDFLPTWHLALPLFIQPLDDKDFSHSYHVGGLVERRNLTKPATTNHCKNIDILRNPPHCICFLRIQLVLCCYLRIHNHVVGESTTSIGYR